MTNATNLTMNTHLNMNNVMHNLPTFEELKFARSYLKSLENALAQESNPFLLKLRAFVNSTNKTIDKGLLLLKLTACTLLDCTILILEASFNLFKKMVEIIPKIDNKLKHNIVCKTLLTVVCSHFPICAALPAAVSSVTQFIESDSAKGITEVVKSGIDILKKTKNRLEASPEKQNESDIIHNILLPDIADSLDNIKMNVGKILDPNSKNQLNEIIADCQTSFVQELSPAEKKQVDKIIKPYVTKIKDLNLTINDESAKAITKQIKISFNAINKLSENINIDEKELKSSGSKLLEQHTQRINSIQTVDKTPEQQHNKHTERLLQEKISKKTTQYNDKVIKKISMEFKNHTKFKDIEKSLPTVQKSVSTMQNKNMAR